MLNEGTARIQIADVAISDKERGRVRFSRREPEREKLIRREFTVSPDGRTVAELLDQLRSREYLVSLGAENAMYYPEFVLDDRRHLAKWNEIDISRSRITVGSSRTLAVISGYELLPLDPIEKTIREEAIRLGLKTPLPEDGPLLRLTISDEEMQVLGFDAIVVMHRPVIDAQGLGNLFCVLRFPVSSQKYVVTHHHLDAVYKQPGKPFPWTWGFAFAK
jgi:hypothetical protein